MDSFLVQTLKDGLADMQLAQDAQLKEAAELQRQLYSIKRDTTNRTVRMAAAEQAIKVMEQPENYVVDNDSGLHEKGPGIAVEDPAPDISTAQALMVLDNLDKTLNSLDSDVDAGAVLEGDGAVQPAAPGECGAITNTVRCAKPHGHKGTHHGG